VDKVVMELWPKSAVECVVRKEVITPEPLPSSRTSGGGEGEEEEEEVCGKREWRKGDWRARVSRRRNVSSLGS